MEEKGSPAAPSKKDAAAQSEFKKNSPENVGSLAASFDAAEACKPVVMFFQDEARFGGINMETACWVKKK